MLERFLYPSVCGFCGKILKSGSICEECKSIVPCVGLKCIPFKQTFYFDELYCDYAYEGVVRSKLLDYKFKHSKYLCKTFAEGMLYRLKSVGITFDSIIPVPVHKSRKKERGYNQSELIAKILSRELKINCNTNVLIKSVKNQKQSRLNKEQRIRNVKNVFEVRDNGILNGKCILLIDDIYTTGATVNECSRILKNAGAKRIIVYTVAKATINSHID